MSTPEPSPSAPAGLSAAIADPPVDAGPAELAETLATLLRQLDAAGYDFVTITPASHAHVVARRGDAEDLRDIFGWSLPFRRETLPPDILEPLARMGVARAVGPELWRVGVRVSRVAGRLFLHSAYPTEAEDAVFLGPDSWRFADLIRAHNGPVPAGARVLDYATGAGVGGIVAAGAIAGARLTLADINPTALFLAGINAGHAGLAPTLAEVREPGDLAGAFDLIVTHPPFMIDPAGRAYRDGGDLNGARLSRDWALALTGLLASGGRLVLHTGVAIVDGEDVLRRELTAALPGMDATLLYHELDPDIFGEELAGPAYGHVERIAAVGAVIVRA